MLHEEVVLYQLLVGGQLLKVLVVLVASSSPLITCTYGSLPKEIPSDTNENNSLRSHLIIG
jgi:hypothetical protein